MPTLTSFSPGGLPSDGAVRVAGAPAGALVRDGWGAVFGRTWRLWLAFGAVLIFLVGAAAPLADPDFGMHLRVGEWIAAHGRVPTTEPFAWTRPGAAYYAYSWLADLAYYATLAAVGPLGLHLLHGAEVFAGAAAVWALARTLGLGAFPTLLVILMHVAAVATIAPNLRPQVVLTAVVPLAWACAVVLARRADSPAHAPWVVAGAAWWPYVLLFGAAVVGANTHLLAPLVAAPLTLLVARRDWRRAALAGACVVAGLACTPYALRWVDVYRLNFARNALFRFPSPIGEHLPGAVAIAERVPVFGVFALWLVCVPWLLPRADGARARAERVLLAALWIGGLALFALAIRGLLVWWLVALPLSAAALGRLPTPSDGVVGRALARVPFVLPAMLALHGVRLSVAAAAWEGWGRAGPRAAVAHVALSPEARAAVSLADTLDRLAPGAAGSRVFTTFNYGNALLWRLPRLSMSVDGRTIFPDSADALDGYVLAADSAAVPNVVRSADVAILPLRHVLARRLDASSGWRRVAVARVVPSGVLVGLVRADTAGLWVTERWAARWVRAAGAGGQ